MMDFDPLSEVPGLDPASVPDGGTAARLRYQQTKINGAPDTILVGPDVVQIVREQQAWVRQQWNLGPDAAPRCLFPKTTGNRHASRPRETKDYNRMLRQFSLALGLRDADGQLLLYSRSHRLRHTKATTLLNAGARVHVVQRYLGHLSPEMTMRYAATLATTAEREFLAMVKSGRDGREIGMDRRDMLDLVQLDRRTDRVLPNEYCLLPPVWSCDKGNACHGCDHLVCRDVMSEVIVVSGLSRRRRYLVLAICCLSLFIVGLDATIVNVAAPDAAFGGWLMPVVPPMVSAATGALLVPHLPAGQVRLTILLACYGMFGLSLIASLVVITQLWQRLVRYPAGPAALVPTLWIVLGPLGQSITAANLLGGVAHLALPPPSSTAFAAFGVVYGVPVWGFAALWAALAAGLTVRAVRQRLPFTLTWWSFTFPVGTCVTAASGLALHTGADAFRWAAVALYIALVGAWTVVSVRTTATPGEATSSCPRPKSLDRFPSQPGGSSRRPAGSPCSRRRWRWARRGLDSPGPGGRR